MRRKIVIANWKMNLSVPESTVLLERYLKLINPVRTEVVVCPSYIDIYSAEKVLCGSSIKVGAQDLFYEDAGSYTGEVSPGQLRGFVEYAIVGHSERRINFGESDRVVAKKAATATRHQITPIVCVGENLHEKMDGLTKLVVLGQVEASLSGLTPEEVEGMVVAYEPIWAIGTGHACEASVADGVAKNIRNLIKVLFGTKAADKVHIVYGGSLDAENIEDFIKKPNLDGFLVGGSSLNHKTFALIVKKVDDAGAVSLNKKPQNSKNIPKKCKKRPKKDKKIEKKFKNGKS